MPWAEITQQLLKKKFHEDRLDTSAYRAGGECQQAGALICSVTKIALSNICEIEIFWYRRIFHSIFDMYVSGIRQFIKISILSPLTPGNAAI